MKLAQKKYQSLFFLSRYIFQVISFSPFLFGLFTHLRLFLFLYKWNILYGYHSIDIFFAFVFLPFIPGGFFLVNFFILLSFAFWLFCRRKTVIYTFFVLSTKGDTGCPLWFELFIFLRFKQKASFFFPMRKYFTFEYAVLLYDDLVFSCFLTCFWLLFFAFFQKIV